MALTKLRWQKKPEEEARIILEFEEGVFEVQRLVTIILNWAFLPFILLSITLTNFMAMTILSIIWVSLIFVWWVAVQIYKVGVMQDWWDEF